MAVRIVNGVKHYEFGTATFVAPRPDGSFGPAANAPINLLANETSPEAPVAIGADNQPLVAPKTDAFGQSPSLWSPQYDTVFADAGAGRKPLPCLDLAEVINDVAATAKDQVLLALEPTITALNQQALTAGDRAKLDLLDLTVQTDGHVLTYDHISAKVRLEAPGGPYAAETHTHRPENVFIVQGEADPAGLVAGQIINETEATAVAFGFDRHLGGNGAPDVTTAAGLTFALAGPVDVGDTTVFCLVASAANSVLANYAISAAGQTAGAPAISLTGRTSDPRNNQASSAQSAQVVVTHAVALAAGTIITVKPDIALAQMAVDAFNINGAATAVSPVDKQTTANATSTAAPAVVLSEATTSADTEVLAVLGFADGRAFTPTGAGVSLAAPLRRTAAGTAARQMVVVRKRLTAAGTVTLGGTFDVAGYFTGCLVAIRKA